MFLNINTPTQFKLLALALIVAAIFVTIVSRSEHTPLSSYLNLNSTVDLSRGAVNSRRVIDKSHSTMQVTNSGPGNYMIHPTVSCRHRDVTLAICVSSSRSNFEARKAIRETWGQYNDAPDKQTALLFFVGTETSHVSGRLSSSQQMLESESVKFGDIVQDSFVDSLRNLTLKTLSILNWVDIYCPKSQFVLKVDDDSYVNVPLLLDHLRFLVNTSDRNVSFIFGQLANSLVPIRDPRSDRFVSLRDYKETLYPSFVYGNAYAMTAAAARALCEASGATPFFYLEDVYVTGLCSRRAGVPIVHSGLFSNYRLPVSGCVFRSQISGHMVHHTEMRRIHLELYDENTTFTDALLTETEPIQVQLQQGTYLVNTVDSFNQHFSEEHPLAHSQILF
ncbi:Beta-1,3-galactosyltransferase 1 [Bulinus truncatus]|nr:Beta-1,3-galactosyltransferase 1 [Bulinus truncatus]